MKEQLLQTWHINNRVNLMLVDAIDDEGMQCTLSPRGGGTPAAQFCHLHNLRLLKLEKFNKDLATNLSNLKKEDRTEKSKITNYLTQSGDAIDKLIVESVDNNGAMKGFKRGVVPFVGYLISHEAHHRGNILLTLKQCGHKLPKAVQYGIWAWNQI